MNNTKLKCPDCYEYSTPDEVAECMGVNNSTYKELWGVMGNPKFKKRSLGGDGSNGTSEVPDDFSGSLPDAWELLSDDAKQDIIRTAADHE